MEAIKTVLFFTALLPMVACELDNKDTGGLAPAPMAPEEVVRIQQAIIDGDWSENLCNGEAPPDPMELGNLPVCAALHSDGLWHPGKLALGQCYYGWGGREHQRFCYRVLKRNPSYTWSFNPGFTPGNAVAGPSGGGALQLPVCATADPGVWAHGKVYLGTCHYGWNGREERTGSFLFVLGAAAP